MVCRPRFLDDDAAARPDHPQKLPHGLLGVDDVVQHVPTPHPVHAPVGQGNRRAVTRLELEALAGGFTAHERARRLHLGQLRLDGHHSAALAHRLGQPERVEPHAAAHVEPPRARRQPQLSDDPPRFRLLEAVHALERDVGAEVDGAHRAPSYQTEMRGAEYVAVL